MKLVHHQLGRDRLFKVWNAAEDNMIILFHSNGGSLVFGNAIYPIEQGAVCFISAGSIHYTMPDDPQVYDRSKLFVPVMESRTLVESLSEREELLRLFSAGGAVYAKIPDAEYPYVEQMLSRSSGSDARIASAFLYLLSLISENNAGHLKAPDSFMAKTVEYVNSSYHTEITLDGLCRVANMSRSHLCHRFKEAMGMTAMEYVLKTRIAAAKGLLLSGALSVNEISERCGFSSISYFSQKFKEETGVTASEFRRGKRGK